MQEFESFNSNKIYLISTFFSTVAEEDEGQKCELYIKGEGGGGRGHTLYKSLRVSIPIRFIYTVVPWL